MDYEFKVLEFLANRRLSHVKPLAITQVNLCEALNLDYVGFSTAMRSLRDKGYIDSVAGGSEGPIYTVKAEGIDAYNLTKSVKEGLPMPNNLSTFEYIVLDYLSRHSKAEPRYSPLSAAFIAQATRLRYTTVQEVLNMLVTRGCVNEDKPVHPADSSVYAATIRGMNMVEKRAEEIQTESTHEAKREKMQKLAAAFPHDATIQAIAKDYA